MLRKVTLVLKGRESRKGNEGRTTMSTDEEKGVKVLGVADELLEFGGLLVEGFVLGEEVHGDLVVFVDGAGVQRGFAAGG